MCSLGPKCNVDLIGTICIKVNLPVKSRSDFGPSEYVFVFGKIFLRNNFITKIFVTMNFIWIFNEISKKVIFP
jgi:hypothetical protein